MPKDNKGKSAVRGGEEASTSDSTSRTASKPYQKRSAPSSSKAKSQHPAKNPRFDKPPQVSSSSGLPGASKIKSSIRQTKRLLSKPNLAPGTKIEAERRLKSLEADLEAVSRKQVEKHRASRYHKVKFVERQKLVRQIARCKRNLARLESGKSKDDSDSDAGSDDDEEQRVKESKMNKSELDEMLGWLRELLHYVVQYPVDLRYVALFPNKAAGPAPPDAKEQDKSGQKAYEHLVRVKKAMQDGKLSGEPEVELSSKDRPRTKLASASSSRVNGGKNSVEQKGAKADKNKRKKDEESSADESDDDEEEEDAGGVKGDDFFAQDSDDE